MVLWLCFGGCSEVFSRGRKEDPWWTYDVMSFLACVMRWMNVVVELCK